MSKAELVEKIADQAKLTKVDAERALNAFIGVVTASLKDGDDVTLVGFGTFAVGKRAERSGRPRLRQLPPVRTPVVPGK